MISKEAPSVYTYPFWLQAVAEGEDFGAGGLRSVLSRELNARRERRSSYGLEIISNDEGSFEIPGVNARVVGVDPEFPLNPQVFGIWFDEHWSEIHPDAYTAIGRDSHELDFLYQGEYSQPEGSVERLLAPIAQYGPSQKYPDAEEMFLRRISNAIENIKPGSVINWQDYIFAPAIYAYADKLRAKGCFQTYHHHMSLPSSLDQSVWGRSLLSAISKVDRAYFHTDEEGERVRWLLEKNGLYVPTLDIRRFDVGIDQQRIIKGMNEVTRDNFMEQPEYGNLTEQQREVIDEIFRTQGIISHRFLDIGRCDPQKGPSVILKGIDEYLSSLGITPEEMRDQYRFFFIMELKDVDPRADYDQYNFWSQYRIYVNQLLTSLQAKYPGVIYASTEIPRTFIPSLLVGAHAMTGGIQDGSNLAVQEALFANAQRDQDATALIGKGTGFAIQTTQDPYNNQLAHFMRVGDKHDVASAIWNTVHTVTNNPGELARRTRELSEKVVMKRNDTVFVRP